MANSSYTHVPASRLREDLSISKFTEKKLCDEGKLTKVKVGNKTFYALAQVNSLFQQG